MAIEKSQVVISLMDPELSQAHLTFVPLSSPHGARKPHENHAYVLADALALTTGNLQVAWVTTDDGPELP
jgi:hypothetical protein